MNERLVEIIAYICLFAGLFAIGHAIKQKQHKTEVYLYVQEHLDSYIQDNVKKQE